MQQALYKLEAEDLRKVCGGLPEIQDFDRKTKRQLIRIILNFLESDEISTSEDGGMATLLSLEDQIIRMLEKEEDDAATKKKKEDKEAKVKQQEAIKALKEAYMNEIAEMEKKMAKLNHPSVKKEGVTEIPPPTHGYRKGCKISGQIGSAQQKDRLTYGSLTHQVDTALRRGYKEDEIVEAVIRATKQGIPLRSVLEGDKDLTLACLKAIIRSHYQEKGCY